MKRSDPIQRKTPMKRTGFQRKPGTPLKRSRLKRVSPKRIAEGKIYSGVRKGFLARPENHHCKVCADLNCFPRHPAVEIHHIRGKEGKMLYDSRFFLPVCRPHHDKIEVEKEWAWKRGYRASRDRKAMQHEGVL